MAKTSSEHVFILLPQQISIWVRVVSERDVAVEGDKCMRRQFVMNKTIIHDNARVRVCVLRF